MAGALNLLDKIINWLSPSRGYRRAFWRNEARAYYDAARVDRFGAAWHPSGRLSAEQTDRYDRSIIRGRARDLERNNSIVQGLLACLDRNVIGPGITPQPAVQTRSGGQNNTVNRQIADLWQQWAANYCDITGVCSFTELQRLFLRRMIVDGDMFVLITYPDNADSQLWPLQLQPVEADLLAEDISEYHDNAVFGGVEVDKYMHPVAYHYRLNPLKSWATVRIPAEYVIHGFKATRSPQLRGVSLLAGCMEPLRDIGEYVDSELKAARIAASVTGVIKTESGANRIGRVNTTVDANGSHVDTIDTGTMMYLKPGEEASFVQPGRPNPSASGFVSLILRQIAVAVGLSYEAVSRDLSQVNYSSIREGRLQDVKTYEDYQRQIIKTYCEPIYKAWLDAMVLKGRLNLPNYWNAKEKYQAVRWIRPGWSWVDPQKEAAAAETSLNLGTTTLQEICGYAGKDWREVLDQRKTELEYINELGINKNGDDANGAGTV